MWPSVYFAKVTVALRLKLLPTPALTAPRKRTMEHEEAPSTSRQLKLRETKLVTQKNVDHAVLNCVTQSLQPFSDLQPNASLISRSTLWRKMDEAVLEMKKNIKKQCQGSISLQPQQAAQRWWCWGHLTWYILFIYLFFYQVSPVSCEAV